MINPLTSYITPDSLKQWPEGSVAVVTHDAGAASLLFSWLTPIQKQLKFCAKGPSSQILGKERPHSKNFTDLSDCLRKCKLVISGTSWASDLEHSARLEAKRSQIPSIATLDHWVNYEERFTRKGFNVIPDTLWVSDKEAAKLAKHLFPSTPVIELENTWLNQLKNEVARQKNLLKSSRTKHQNKLRLLYLLEPMRDLKTGIPNSEEFLALDYWVSSLPRLLKAGHLKRNSKEINLILRPHPSEARDKYSRWMNDNSSAWNIEIDDHCDLATSLALADAAFGCETQALVAATECKIKSFNTLSPKQHECRLPHKNIISIKNLMENNDYI